MQVLTNELKPHPIRLYLIARALDEEIKNFFKNPANESAFEEWDKRKGEEKENDR